MVLRDSKRKPSPGLLTVTKVAELLHAHPTSIRRWADQGLLNCYRLGLRGDRRFSREDVALFLRRNKSE